MLQKILSFLISLVRKNPEVIAEFAFGKPDTAEPSPTISEVQLPGYQLKYFRFEAAGIFGEMKKDGEHVCYVLDEPVLECETSYAPVVLPGTYSCQRRMSPHFGYDVFQILDVPGHTYIEIHIGNKLSDTHGCLLMGTAIEGSALTESKKAFDSFMASMEGIDTFELTVV